LRNALLPIITLFGLAFPFLFTGAVLIETVFAWPGMGRLAVNAIFQRDYPVVTGAALLTSAMVVLGNLIADALYAVADPRIRVRGGEGAPEYLELARGGRGRGAGARRRRGAATTRASDRAGAAVLPPPDGGARRVRAHLLRDHRHRRTCRGTVPTVLPDRYRTPQPPALRTISPRHRPAQS